jgi:hypothetical protein
MHVFGVDGLTTLEELQHAFVKTWNEALERKQFAR